MSLTKTTYSMISGAPVNIIDYGAIGDGVTNDTTAIQAALDSLIGLGGTVVIPNSFRCYVATDLTIPENVSLVGPNVAVGIYSYEATSLSTIGGTILLNSAATINLSSGACLSGILIYRYGMTFPVANSSSFAGTAITATGRMVYVENCMIVGFNKAFYSNNQPQIRLNNLWLDNNNNIEISASYDISYISNCHAWPFASMGGDSGTPIESTKRTGTAFSFQDVSDWTKVTNCFSYGYKKGFVANNVSSMEFVSCGADNLFDVVPLYTDSQGFVIEGTSTKISLTACEAAAQDRAGIEINTTATDTIAYMTKLTNCTFWANKAGAIIDNGDASFEQCSFDGYNLASTFGIGVGNATSTVLVNDCVSSRMTEDIALSASTYKLYLGNTNVLNSPKTVNYNYTVAQSIASADPLILPKAGTVFNVTGTTNFGTINDQYTVWTGKTVTLIFNGILTVGNGTSTAGNIRLNGSASFVTAPGSTLTLMHNGTQWYEIGRSA